MARRNYIPRHPDGSQGLHDGPQLVMGRRPGPLPIHSAALEEELEMQHREMHRIVAENRLVIDDNMLLRKESTDTKDKIYRLREVIPTLELRKRHILRIW